ELVEKVNPTKVEVAVPELDAALVKETEGFVKKQVDAALKAGDLDFDPIFKAYLESHEEIDYKLANAVFSKVWKKAIRNLIAQGKRTDGRKIDEIRPIGAEVGILPRTHGSALFSR